MKLNLGAGDLHKDGYLSVDWNPIAKPDVVMDLNVFPYPFENETIDEVLLYHVLEHLEKPFEVMRELHRVLKKGGILHVKVPHYSRGFAHPEHCHGFDINFPIFFNRNSPGSHYLGFEFAVHKIRFQWDPFLYLLPYLGYPRWIVYPLRGVNTVFSFLANLCKPAAARLWCYWVGGFSEIEFVFTKPQ